MAQLGRAATDQDILVSEHGRRFGIVGDGATGNPSALMLDNKVVASNRLRGGVYFVKAITAIAAGPVTLTGAAVGDIVVSATDISTAAEASSRFETVITVANQIQQLSASTDVHLIVLYCQS